MNTEVIQTLTPLVLGIGGILLSGTMLLSNSDRETKQSVKDIALAAVSVAGGAMIGSKGVKQTNNIETEENNIKT